MKTFEFDGMYGTYHSDDLVIFEGVRYSLKRLIYTWGDAIEKAIAL
jgi:hypothetical protein